MGILTQIKNIFTGNVIFEAEVDGETESIRLGITVKLALKSRARLDGASLVGARLDRAILDGASLDGAILDGASLDGASLDGARLDRASLVGASLVGASLDGARLDGARLVGASLVGASLDGARLVGASLDGARLVGASLVGASLDGARLDGASLDGAIGLFKIMGVEPGNFYWKRFESELINNGFQFKVGLNVLQEGEVFASDERVTCSFPGFHFASRSWCAVNYPERPLEARIRIPEDAQINEPWATDGKASADKIEILQVFEVATGRDVTDEYR